MKLKYMFLYTNILNQTITAYLSFTISSTAYNVISGKETAEHFMVGEENELMCSTFMNDLMTVLSNLILLQSQKPNQRNTFFFV